MPVDKIRVVHYINQFFSGIGGEEQADIPPELREGAVGPGLALQKSLGEDFEVVATVLCGDTHFGAHIEADTAILLEMIKQFRPQLFVAGPAFNAGRYGVACGTIAKAVQDRLGIPVLTGMYAENPGVDLFHRDIFIVKTGNSAADMRKSMPRLAALAKKLARGEEISGPEEDAYYPRGIRVNYFAQQRGSERGIQMLVKKMAGTPFVTEYPMPVFDRVPPAPPVPDIRTAKIGVVTSGGIVPAGNPDHIESSSATKYGVYSIAGMDRLDKKDFMTVHGGYDRSYVLEDPNLVVPLDALRELEGEGVFGGLADYFISTTGTGTSTDNARRFALDFIPKLLEDQISAVILTST